MEVAAYWPASRNRREKNPVMRIIHQNKTHTPDNRYIMWCGTDRPATDVRRCWTDGPFMPDEVTCANCKSRLFRPSDGNPLTRPRR